MNDKMNDEAYDFGARLKYLRNKRCLTQKNVAEHLDVTINTISGYENNTQIPGIETLKKLSRLYWSSPDYILGFGDNNTIVIDDLKDYQKRVIECALIEFRNENLKTRNNEK